MRIFLLTPILFLVSGVLQANISFDWRNNQLHQLEKITVGPWDNFGTTFSYSGIDAGAGGKKVNGEGAEIIYTQDRNQILSLFKHDLNRNESEKLEFASGDIKQPTYNNSKKILAFTYFGSDAQGDVCIFQFENKKMDCLSSGDGVEQSPFWLGDSKVGYLKRQADSLSWDLVIYDLTTSKSKIIASGAISAPTASNDGKYILFNDKVKNKQVLRLLDVASKSEVVLPEIDLPGDVGFTAFSSKDEYIYFSYYLNDTNFDQIINADDNSVIFRLPFNQWKNANFQVYPEQLTSVDYNCKFPSPGKEFLYLTCAFEGSLDIYRLPLTGMVGKSWKKVQLEEAHLIARSYEQRLLLLNAMRYRNKALSPDMLQRFIGNHVHIGEITAARYYISQLLALERSEGKERKISEALRQFYSVLDLLLYVRSEKNKYKNDIVTISFQKLAKKIKNQITVLIDSGKDNAKGIESTKKLAYAFIENELGNDSEAIKYLDSAGFNEYTLEVQKYLAVSLYEGIILKDGISGEDLPKQSQSQSKSQNKSRLSQLYFKMLNDMGVSYDFRLYYASKYLSLGLTDGLAGGLAVGLKLESVKDDQIKPLFSVDKLAKDLLLVDDAREKTAIYKKMSKLIKSNRDNVLLRKAMHVRAINLFSDNNEYKFMELTSRHWLTVSQIREMEFVNVANQYSKINKDKAYGFIHQEELAKAFNIFYPVIRQTNDLEAYYQYLTIGMKSELGQKENLEKSLAVLKKQKLLGEQEKYTDALRIIIEKGENAKTLDEALALLLSIDSKEATVEMQELLLGYLYHRKMQLTQKGYEYDKRLYKNAHYHYMLALDLARNNGRVSATVLQNLGWLHKSVGQYALAVNYFERRELFPFISTESEQSLRWVLANAYFYNNQSALAYKQMKLVLDSAALKDATFATKAPFLEKAAFYAMQATQYKVAVNLYSEYFSNSTDESSINASKMKLAYAYSLNKTGNRLEAIKQFRQVLQVADSLKIAPANNQRLVSFIPARQKLIANGFISSMSDDAAAKEAYLLDRIKLLISLKGSNDISFDESARLAFLAKDYQKLALLYEADNKNKKMVDAINQSLDVAAQWVSSSGDSMGPVNYRVLINYLSLGLSHTKLFHQQDHKKLDAAYKEMSDSFKAYPYPAPAMIYQQAKAEILWRAFSRDVKGSGEFKPQSILASKQVTGLGDEYIGLKKLADHFGD